MAHSSEKYKTYFSNFKILIYLLFICSLLGYYISYRQQTYSQTEYYAAFGIMVISMLIYFRAKNKSNYCDFDTLFLFTCIPIGYLATSAYFSPLFERIIVLDFDYSYINKGTWLFTIGIISYLLGSLIKPKIAIHRSAQLKIIPTKGMFYILIVFMILFIAGNGFQFYRTIYMSDTYVVASDLIGLYSQVIIAASIILTTLELLNKKNFPSYKLHKYYFIAIGSFATIIMIFGNRTIASQLILPIICLYTLFFKPIKFKKFLFILIPVAIIMYIIQITRAGNELSFKLESPLLMAADLTIPYRSTFEAMRYVDDYGFTFGKNMTGGILRSFPIVAGAIVGESRDFGSAELLTDYYFISHPNFTKFGLGTNIVADLYLSFGTIGVILFMFLLGYIINKLVIYAKHGNLYSTITLSALLANSVFLARASYTHAVVYILWSVVGTYIYLFFLYKKH